MKSPRRTSHWAESDIEQATHQAERGSNYAQSGLANPSNPCAPEIGTDVTHRVAVHNPTSPCRGAFIMRPPVFLHLFEFNRTPWKKPRAPLQIISQKGFVNRCEANLNQSPYYSKVETHLESCTRIGVKLHNLLALNSTRGRVARASNCTVHPYLVFRPLYIEY